MLKRGCATADIMAYPTHPSRRPPLPPVRLPASSCSPRPPYGCGCPAPGPAGSCQTCGRCSPSPSSTPSWRGRADGAGEAKLNEKEGSVPLRKEDTPQESGIRQKKAGRRRVTSRGLERASPLCPPAPFFPFFRLPPHRRFSEVKAGAADKMADSQLSERRPHLLSSRPASRPSITTDL